MSSASDVDSQSMPSELPLSQPAAGGGESPLPSDLDIDSVGAQELDDDAGVAAGADDQDVPAPRRQPDASATANALELRLVPAPQRNAPRGRGRGRPRNQPLRLVAIGDGSPRGAEDGASRAAQAQAAASAAVVQPNRSMAWGAHLGTRSARDVAKVQHSAEGLGPPTVFDSFAALPADSNALMAAIVAREAQGDGLGDHDVMRVTNFFMSGVPCALAPVAAISAIVNVERVRLQQLARRCAAALVGLTHARLNRLETCLAQQIPRACLLYYVEGVQYDETPLKTRVIGDSDLVTDGQPTQPEQVPMLGDGSIDSHSLVCRIGQSRTLEVSTSSAPQKIVQTRAEIGMVVRLGQRLVTLVLRPCLPLCAVERTTAKCLMRQQAMVSHAGRAARAFGGCIRAATTDAYSANKAAEGGIARDRSAGAESGSSLHVLCGVHATAGVYNKVFGPLDEHISGVIHAALALRNGPAMSRLRKCMRVEIASRFELLRGSPPQSAIDYKKNVLQMFVSHGSATLTRRALLSICPNGEWRSERVQFYIDADCPPELQNRESIVNHLANGIIIALAASRPSVYNRSRWTGSDRAIDDLGIFEAVHRLLSTTFTRFAASFHSGLRAQHLLAKLPDLRVYDKRPRRALAQDPAEDEDADAELADPGRPEEDAGRAKPGGEGNTKPEEPDWVQQNRMHRRQAMALISSNPLGNMMLIRLLMEPLRVYLGRQFERAGEAWDFAERARVAAAANEGKDYKRRFRIAEVAEGKDDEHFMAQLRMLFEAMELWSILPGSFHTVANRALVFKSLSRLGCAFEKLLSSRHRSPPFQTFRCLTSADVAAKIQSMSECLLDGWTKSLLAKFPDLNNGECQHVLATVAALVKVDTSDLESRHASIRRMLVARSVQTHSLSFSDLSAQWVFQQHRTAQKRTSGARLFGKGQQGASRAAKKRADAKSRSKASAGRKQKSGFGGAWRAWVRRHCAGRSIAENDLTAVAADFAAGRAAGSAEFQEATRVGRAATGREVVGELASAGWAARVPN